MIPSAETLHRAGRIIQEIEALQAELAGLFGGDGGGRRRAPRGRPAGAIKAEGRGSGKRREMSLEAKARIAAAARARWAKYREAKNLVQG